MKVKLNRPEFSSEYGGKLPAGAVVEVPDEVGQKWQRLGLAGSAGDATKTHREQSREELLKERERLNKLLGDDAAASAAWDVEGRATDQLRHEAESVQVRADEAKARADEAEHHGRREGLPGPVNTPIEAGQVVRRGRR